MMTPRQQDSTSPFILSYLAVSWAASPARGNSRMIGAVIAISPGGTTRCSGENAVPWDKVERFPGKGFVFIGDVPSASLSPRTSQRGRSLTLRLDNSVEWNLTASFVLPRHSLGRASE